MYEHGVTGAALNLNSTGYPNHGRCGDLPLQGKIPTAEPGIEPGASWPVARSSDHQATRLITHINVQTTIMPTALWNADTGMTSRYKPELLPRETNSWVLRFAYDIKAFENHKFQHGLANVSEADSFHTASNHHHHGHNSPV
jgi:hypothetical protein